MLAAIEEGRGIPVVLLHAFPLTRAMWEPQYRFADLCRLILPDLPGFGRSARAGEPTIRAMAWDVLSLLDRLNVRDPVVLGGLSMGGYVALEVLRQAPERVRALGLFSTRATADTPAQREARMATIAQIRNDGLAPFAQGFVKRALGASTLARQPAVAERVSALISQNQADGVIDALLAMAQRPDASALLPAIGCPVLVVGGDEDPVVPLAQARAMHGQIPGADLAVIPGAGHLVNLEQPDAFADALGRFLVRLRAGGQR